MAETTRSSAATSLPKEVFAVEVNNHELLKVAYLSYLANSRTASATTKRRGEVSGGGKKPWKQKGTGRARFGSSRNPIWRGGGIVFGPLGNENYKLKLSTAAKRQAVRQALSLANKDNEVTVVADIKAAGKTKDIVKFLTDNKLNEKRRVLLVVDEKTPELLRSSKNLPNVELIRATYLSVFLVMNADAIVFTQKALDATTAWLKKEGK